jgi:uncharacterized membrane protein (UPF0127 family)
MRITVEIADTPAKLAQGLMYRDEMPEDHGMLFIFPNEQNLKFWGKNTFLPLDIAFIKSSGEISSIKHINTQSIAGSYSDEPCLMALEVNRGFFKRNNFSSGDRIIFDSEGEVPAIRLIKSPDGRIGTQGRHNKTAQVDPNFKVEPSPVERDRNPRSAPKVHPMVPYSSDDKVPMPEWMDGIFEEEEREDGSTMPVVDWDNLSMADDEEDSFENQDPYDFDGDEPWNQYEDDEFGEEDGDLEGDIPDASNMSVIEAISYAEDNGLEIQIEYVTLHQRKKIGPPQGGSHLTRVVQPHGIRYAKTTHRNILVTWDRTVNNFRGFAVEQIQNVEFTGDKFKQWFRVAA